MMYRYADFLGMDTAASGSLSRFHDGSQVSPWASDAMKWAVRNGLISGKSPTILDPKGNATRAEVATILQRMNRAHGEISASPKKGARSLPL